MGWFCGHLWDADLILPYVKSECEYWFIKFNIAKLPGEFNWRITIAFLYPSKSDVFSKWTTLESPTSHRKQKIRAFISCLPESPTLCQLYGTHFNQSGRWAQHTYLNTPLWLCDFSASLTAHSLLYKYCFPPVIGRIFVYSAASHTLTAKELKMQMSLEGNNLVIQMIPKLSRIILHYE
jgi:hypothetical protein